MSRVTHFLSPLLESPGRWELTIERTGDILVQRVELARDSLARKRGLLGRERLDEGDGLIIAPSQGVHTFGMRFPIDIVAVARDGRVVKVRSRVPARRLVMAWSAFAIIEMAEGTIERRALVAGDRVRLRPA